MLSTESILNISLLFQRLQLKREKPNKMLTTSIWIIQGQVQCSTSTNGRFQASPENDTVKFALRSNQHLISILQMQQNYRRLIFPLTVSTNVLKPKAIKHTIKVTLLYYCWFYY